MSEQAFPPGSYPSMPGEVSYGGDVKGPPPSPVVNAVKLMFARAALSVLGVLALAFTRSDLRQRIVDSKPGFSPSQVDSAVTAGIAAGVVFGLIFTVLYVLLALQVRKGRSWARIVTIVLAVLGLLGGVVGVLGTAAPVSKVLSVVDLLLDLGILVLLLAPASAEYFRRTR